MREHTDGDMGRQPRGAASNGPGPDRRGHENAADQAGRIRGDERRFERHSDRGVPAYGRDREAAYRGEEMEQRHRRGGAGGGAPQRSGPARGEDRLGPYHLGPYQDSWELGTGRGGRGLAGDGDRGRSGGGYSAMARGGYGGESRRGRGPRDDRRPDARIREDVCERLTEDDYVDAREIDVQVLEGTVTLTGSVEERWQKHRAEDIADACRGVREVENRIRVHRAQEAPGASPGASPSASTTTATPDGGTAHSTQPTGTRADRNEIGNSG